MTQEKSTVINILKKSGYNRARGENKRKQVLDAELKKLGLSQEQYDDLVAKSNRPFVTLEGGEILIVAHNVGAFLANTAHKAPKNICGLEARMVRTAVHVRRPGFTTGKHLGDVEAIVDGKRTLGDAKVWGRFVKLEKSNQRSWQENWFIDNFEAQGVFQVDERMVTVEKLRSMVEWGGIFVGIGASRGQDYGRFELVKFEEIA
jgi:hypothetical protein